MEKLKVGDLVKNLYYSDNNIGIVIQVGDYVDKYHTYILRVWYIHKKPSYKIWDWEKHLVKVQ